MPVTATEQPRLSDLLKVQDYPLYQAGYCTDVVTANETTATDYQVGDLLGTVTATGDYKLADSSASDGSQTITAIVIENKSLAANTDTEVSVLVRGGVIIADKALNSTQVTDYTLATIRTRLLAVNPPILVGDQL